MKNNLIIVSPSKERIFSWKLGLTGFIRASIITDRLDIIWDDIMRIEPDVILLDMDLLGLNSLNDIATLRRLCTKTSVVILSDVISEDMEWKLLKAGIRGRCSHDIGSELLKQVVMAVQQGELWIRRKLTSRLVTELGRIASKNKAYQASHDLLNKLTPREYVIALHVGNGQNNKQIARSCAITERTVKSHLSEVFHKLGITDRINLALIISKDNLHQRKSDSHVIDNNS